MDWTQMMGEQEDPTQIPGGGAPYSGMMQPGPDLSVAHRPAASPQEYEQRLTGWQQLANRFMSDPNLQRSLFLTGAMLTQPIQPGQTTSGAIGNAAVVGMNAYQVGQQANLAQQAALRKEARENKELGIREQESQARIAESGERVETARAARPGVQAQSDVAVASVEDAIKSAQLNRRKLETAVSEADKQAAVDAIKRDNEALSLYAKRPNIGRAVEQELRLNDAKLAQAGAATRAGVATARQTELENEGLESLTPAERARLKSTRGTTSGTVQQFDMWANAYDRIKQQNPDSPEIKGFKTRDEYAARMLSTSKEADPAVLLSRLAGVLDEDDELILQLRADIASRRSGTPPPATNPPPKGSGKQKPKGPVTISTDEEFNALPSGTIFIGPDGKRRRKP